MTTRSVTFTPDQLAAHELLSELRTRIATQPLPYQYGIEARALESLWEVFSLARKAMKDHPGCVEFSRLTTTMLNVDLRPVTAKWHKAFKAGILESRDGSNAFREDLERVRLRLVQFAESLQIMAYGESVPDDITPTAISTSEIDYCFEGLLFGIEGDSPGAELINRSEREAISDRRESAGLPAAIGMDAAGLALSGGGIRSATFCLGVIQVLAERKLLKHFDFLSTVSGGGYTGSFITLSIASGEPIEELGSPHGPDSKAIRSIRRNAKYLRAANWKERWIDAIGVVAGLLLNLCAPLFALSFAAIVLDLLNRYLDQAFWLEVAGIVALCAAIQIVGYGVALRTNLAIKQARVLLGILVAVGFGAGAMALIEWCYKEFRSLLAVPGWVLSTVAALVLVSPVLARFLPLFRTSNSRKRLLKIALVAAGAVVPVVAAVGFFLLRELGHTEVSPFAAWWPALSWSGSSILIAICLVSGSLSLLVLDINLTGPQKLYRDQLANTFLRRASQDRDVALSTINFGSAPYHLINATVNLPSSKSSVLRDRKSDFFLMSKHWTGSSAVGYARTSEWEINKRPIDLATAMAISGAAASPQMGLESYPTLSALLTLLNIRLGSWIRNPKVPRFAFASPGFLCLLREMTGIGMAETSKWLNVSDGGHIENMGLYELLRRRCKFIVCVDGEADPQSVFHGHLTLVRHAQIDLGIRLEPRFDDMRPDQASRYSRAHAQLFRINYPQTSDGRPAGLGLLLYLKLSLTGDEAELLKQYRSLNPEFPHQSTLDQFFDEEQFESYRQLGVHVAEGMFARALLGRAPAPADLRQWFRQLALAMLEPTA